MIINCYTTFADFNTGHYLSRLIITGLSTVFTSVEYADYFIDIKLNSNNCTILIFDNWIII